MMIFDDDYVQAQKMTHFMRNTPVHILIKLTFNVKVFFIKPVWFHNYYFLRIVYAKPFIYKTNIDHCMGNSHFWFISGF